jgi:hypothetical protein
MTNQLFKRYTPSYSTFIKGYKEEGDAYWYNPEEQAIYVGEDSNQNPTWDEQKWDVAEYISKQNLKKEGRYNDEVGAALAGVNPNDYGKAQEFLGIVDQVKADGSTKNLDKYIRSAAILTREDFLSFKTVRAQAKIIKTTVQKHALLGIIPQQNTSDFTTKIFTQGAPYDVVSEDVPELFVPDDGYMNFTSQTVNLKRYMTHQRFSEEFLSESYDVDIRGAVLENMVGQIDLVKNKKIADVLNAATYTSGNSWTAETGGVSDNDPGVDIDTEITKLINTNKGSGNWVIGSNLTTWRAFENNTFNTLKGTANYEQVNYSYGNSQYSSIKRFPGLRWVVDSFLAKQKATIFDPEAVLFLNGPTRTVNYTSQYQDYRGTITKVFFVVKAIDTDRILGVSGVTAEA